MFNETKQDVLEKTLSMEKPTCPHCETPMQIWEVPDVAVGDGLGWGTPYLFICFNDTCSVYENGWENIRENYAHNASYRCINYPGTTQYECIPVFSPEGAKGQMLDDSVLAEREALKEKTKLGFSMLTDFYITKDWDEILRILLDPSQPGQVRLKAADMVGELGGAEAIEPLVNHKFPTPVLAKAAKETIEKLHERNFTRECPFCAEIIKKRAAVCRSCGKEVAGQ
jgi:hypothetical protein